MPPKQRSNEAFQWTNASRRLLLEARFIASGLFVSCSMGLIYNIVRTGHVLEGRVGKDRRANAFLTYLSKRCKQ